MAVNIRKILIAIGEWTGGNQPPPLRQGRLDLREAIGLPPL
jgi:hypothetical protein